MSCGCGCCPKCGCQATCTCNRSMCFEESSMGDFSYMSSMKREAGEAGKCGANCNCPGTCASESSSRFLISQDFENEYWGHANSGCLDGASAKEEAWTFAFE